MYVTTKFSPVTVTFETPKEWKAMRRLLKDVTSQLDHKRRGGYNPLVSYKDLNEEEQQVYMLCNKILEATTSVGTDE